MVETQAGSNVVHLTGIRPLGGDRCLVFGHYRPRSGGGLRTRVMSLSRGRWAPHLDLPMLAQGIAPLPGPADALLVLTRAGVVLHTPGRRAAAADSPAPRGPLPGPRGLLMDLRLIGGRYHTCGLRGQVYRLAARATWEPVGGGLSRYPGNPDALLTLTSIDGRAADDLYAVGLHGSVFHWNGTRWSELESPTDAALHRVLALDDGRLIMCGEEGSVFVGGRQGWQAVEGPYPGVTLRDLASFERSVYALSQAGRLYAIGRAHRHLEAVAPPGHDGARFGQLVADRSALWAVDDTCVWRFDGHEWARHVCPPEMLGRARAQPRLRLVAGRHLPRG